MNNVHTITDWDAYSLSFQSVMPSEMLKLNRETTQWLNGSVADFGCGGGKIIPFVLEQERVTSYTGIDASMDMVERARWMADRFCQKQCNIIHDKIQSVLLPPVDSAVSINSYYTWPDPESVLLHIHKQLKEDALFVLATINASIDMPALLEDAEKELAAHPHWNAFKQHNMDIYASDSINLVSMDSLIGQVRQMGFQIIEAHTNLYKGGLNFLVIKKQKVS